VDEFSDILSGMMGEKVNETIDTLETVRNVVIAVVI
jgi:hypothetical protein